MVMEKYRNVRLLDIQKTNCKLIDINLLVITLNILIQSKGRRAKWIKNHDPPICYLQGKYFRFKDTNILKEKEWKKTNHENRTKKQAGVAILIPDKIDFKTKVVA